MQVRVLRLPTTIFSSNVTETAPKQPSAGERGPRISKSMFVACQNWTTISYGRMGEQKTK
jgi:hypothetical protein